jgi:hypothetical protein
MPHPEIMDALGETSYRDSSHGDSSQVRFAPELCQLKESERVSACEVLDRVLNKGVVVAGEVTISVAGIDLLYLGLQLVLTSIETARSSLHNGQPQGGQSLDIGKPAQSERSSHGVGWNHAASRV